MEVSQKIYANQGNPEVLSRIPPKAGVALDVGCGAGANAAHLKSVGWTVDGITLSEAERAQASLFCRTVLIHNLEEGLPPFSSTYDCILCSHVLEHICYPTPLLDAIHQSLEPDGLLIVALPNILWWKNRLKLLFGKFEYCETGLMDYTHFRFYTFESAQRLLKDHGFHITEALPDGGIPLSHFRSTLPRWSFAWADRAARSVAPGLVAYQMVFCATKTAS